MENTSRCSRSKRKELVTCILITLGYVPLHLLGAEANLAYHSNYFSATAFIMPHPLEQWFLEVPLVTRTYALLSLLTTLACQMKIVSPFNLYYNYQLVVYGRQYWRLLTNFLYFGSFSLDFLFHMYFLTRYSRMLEEGSFSGRTADFCWLLVYGAVFMLILGSYTSLHFLGSPLTFMLVYIWSRRNPYIRLNFLGLFVFTAPYLPWVFLSLSVLLNNSFPTGDLLGITVGHLYYYLDDVYPRTHNASRYLRAPQFLKRWFDEIERDEDSPYVAEPTG